MAITAIAEMTCSRGHHWFVEAAVWDPETGKSVWGSGVDYCIACEMEVRARDFCQIWADPDHDTFSSEIYWGRVFVAEEMRLKDEPPEWLQDKWEEAWARKVEFPRNPNKALVAWQKAGGEGVPVVHSRRSRKERKAKAKS